MAVFLGPLDPNAPKVKITHQQNHKKLSAFLGFSGC
jgi:hypothetical protein